MGFARSALVLAVLWAVASPAARAADPALQGSTTVHAVFAPWLDGYPHPSGSVASAFLAVQP